MDRPHQFREYLGRFAEWCKPKSLAEFIEIAAAAFGTIVFVRWLMGEASLGALRPLLPLFGVAFFAYLLWAIVLVRRLLYPAPIPTWLASATSSQASFAPPADTKPRPDVWLRDATFYCVHRRWLGDLEEGFTADTQYEEAAGLLKEIRQLARNGDITIWGKRWNNSTFDPIDPDYWEHHEVEYMELFKDKSEDVRTGSATPEGKDGPFYKALRVSKTQFEQRWPPTAGLVPLWKAAQSVYEKTRAADMYSHQSLDGKIQYHAIALTLDGRSQDPPIYAVRPGTDAFVVLPPSALSNTYMMKDNYGRIVDANLRDRVEWERVSVRMADLDAHIARQKDDMRQHRAKGGKVWGDG